MRRSLALTLLLGLALGQGFLGVNFWRESPPGEVVQRLVPLSPWVRWGGAYREEALYTRFDLLWFRDFLKASQARGAWVQLSFRQTLARPDRLHSQLEGITLLTPRALSLGHEPDWAAEHGLLNLDPLGYARAWRNLALTIRLLAARGLVPRLPLYGPSLSQIQRWDWLEAFLAANRDLVEGVDLHYFPFQRVGLRTSPDFLLAEPERLRGLLREARARIRQAAGRDLPLYIGAFNLSRDPADEGPYGPNSPWAALWLGLTLGVFLEEGVRGAFYWSLYDDGALSLVSGGGRVRPAYYALLFFRDAEPSPRTCHTGGLRGYALRGGWVFLNPNPRPQKVRGCPVPPLEAPAWGLVRYEPQAEAFRFAPGMEAPAVTRIKP